MPRHHTLVGEVRRPVSASPGGRRAKPVVWILGALVAGALASPAGARASTEQANLGRAVGSYLQHRAGSVSVGVYDAKSNQAWGYRAGRRYFTASIVKVDILETLLNRQGRLSGDQRALAARMIERSDNDAATALWNAAGRGRGIARFNWRAGLRSTTFDPAGRWGLTRTTVTDQLELLKQLAFKSRLLVSSQQRYELGLMQRVVPWQAWGVSGGVAEGASVALKNGWLPRHAIVNSIGIVDGRGHRYLVAVLTESPTTGYGIATIGQVSKLVWRNTASG